MESLYHLLNGNLFGVNVVVFEKEGKVLALFVTVSMDERIVE